MLPSSSTVLDTQIDISKLVDYPRRCSAHLCRLNDELRGIFGERVDSKSMFLIRSFWLDLAEDIAIRKMESSEDLDEVLQGEWDNLSAIIATSEKADLDRGATFCRKLLEHLLAEGYLISSRGCFAA